MRRTEEERYRKTALPSPVPPSSLPAKSPPRPSSFSEGSFVHLATALFPHSRPSPLQGATGKEPLTPPSFPFELGMEGRNSRRHHQRPTDRPTVRARGGRGTIGRHLSSSPSTPSEGEGEGERASPGPSSSEGGEGGMEEEKQGRRGVETDARNVSLPSFFSFPSSSAAAAAATCNRFLFLGRADACVWSLQDLALGRGGIPPASRKQTRCQVAPAYFVWTFARDTTYVGVETRDRADFLSVRATQKGGRGTFQLAAIVQERRKERRTKTQERFFSR